MILENVTRRREEGDSAEVYTSSTTTNVSVRSDKFGEGDGFGLLDCIQELSIIEEGGLVNRLRKIDRGKGYLNWWSPMRCWVNSCLRFSS